MSRVPSRSALPSRVASPDAAAVRGRQTASRSACHPGRPAAPSRLRRIRPPCLYRACLPGPETHACCPSSSPRFSVAATIACSSSTGASSRRSTRSRRATAALSDDELKAKTAEFRARLAQGETLDDAAAGSVRGGPRGRQARAQDAPLRRAADRRHGAARRQDRRDAHRRRQDAGGHAAGLPERADRQGRARRHGQRLPRPARRRMDGPHLQLPRPDGRRQPVAA